ncbi:hypothetical protein A2361_00310 [Candidatus Woesebacteria bacterium RIFOXYB1_FULL_40_26]|uniref:Uncharacterized protein n=2 Tax=Candidatus Woeseibacteriota TaxID=1752722 RepID=A0A1F8DJE4_9BACT|nr:MAG: hypothetical protein A2361_00310 [Candidatus Woesebacteria bacterium RIFOXYB1_FULL_40_26]OGM88526.1 MAG: hypothetical protein A2614_00950 [Candidatus Woesebacteria bacterium RIFOXYD1_FULL_40_21]
MSSEISTRVKDAFFIATHPILSIKAKVRQVFVAIEHEAPPQGITFEEFPELSLADAARAIMAAGEKETGGVPKSAWSKADRERMARGERPLGHPEHPNI